MTRRDGLTFVAVALAAAVVTAGVVNIITPRLPPPPIYVVSSVEQIPPGANARIDYTTQVDYIRLSSYGIITVGFTSGLHCLRPVWDIGDGTGINPGDRVRVTGLGLEGTSKSSRNWILNCKIVAISN
jgi:hypothetical protein